MNMWHMATLWPIDENEGDSALSSVGLLGGENPEGEANSSACQGGPFSALTPSMWPSKGMLNFLKKSTFT